MRRFFGVRGRYSICRNSSVEIGRGSKGRGVKFQLVNSRVTIGESCNLASLKIKAINCNISIGSNTTFVGHSDISSLEGCDIFIGNDCLIANGCWITTSDLHVINEASNGERLNTPKPITIEDRVWLAREVVILKGAVIGKGSAIGIRSVVTKHIPSECIAVGAPAKPVKHNIRWER